MAKTPQFLTVARNRDRVGQREVPIRRALVLLVCLLLVAALLNVFGQRPATSQAGTAAAVLKVYAPTRIRSGLYYEARFTITARHELKNAMLQLESGWLEGMTLNTVEPSPIGEASRNGNLVLTLGHIRAGAVYILYLQFQVNPTNVGHRAQNVALYDGGTFLTSVDRTITIFP
jgi:hypothetical protein